MTWAWNKKVWVTGRKWTQNLPNTRRAFYPLSYHGEQGNLTDFTCDRCPAYLSHSQCWLLLYDAGYVGSVHMPALSLMHREGKGKESNPTDASASTDALVDTQLAHHWRIGRHTIDASADTLPKHWSKNLPFTFSNCYFVTSFGWKQQPSFIREEKTKLTAAILKMKH